MKREDAIKIFVKDNYEFLTNKNVFDKPTYRTYLRNYFAKRLKYKFGVPRDKEICDTLVEIIIKQRTLCKIEDLESIISSTPLLKLNNIRGSDYRPTIDSIGRKFTLKEEIEKVTGIERLEKITEHVKKEEVRTIEELIIQKKEEYRKLPSILDDVDFTEPEELPQKDETKEWWEELNLKENPFPGPLDGFFNIDKSLYDEIIVETPPIQWALDRIRRDRIDVFHKGFLLGGDFGTGKTTFYDFMAPHLTMKHVEPIRIALSDSINVANYLQKFERELSLGVVKIARNYSIRISTNIFGFEEARLLMLEIQERGARGFFIFLDDLHKNTDRNSVFNFLASLQITKNTLSREGINAAFFVAGFPDWKTKIRQDSALTGFFDAADDLTLPDVTPEIAAQAIRKRLQAFSINPGKEITVKEEFLRTVFRKVSAEIGRRNIGFRPYIQEALNCFAARKFDILGIDYIKLDDNVMKKIKGLLESFADFKESIDKLVFGKKIQKKEIREMTLKILCEVYVRRGVTEDEEIFNGNKFSFKRLEECGLIQKHRRNDKLVWYISPLLKEINERIRRTFMLSMEDYLVPIYSVTTMKPKVQKGVEIFESDLEGWRSTLEPNINESLSEALKKYVENIYPYSEMDAKSGFALTSSELDRMKESIWLMMKCIIRFESPSLLDIYGESDILGWTLRYRSLETSEHFISLSRNLGVGDERKTDLARLIVFANDSFAELWNEFRKSVQIYQSSLVRCSEIPKKLLRNIYFEHQQVFSFNRPQEEYFQVLNRFVHLVETTIRKYLLVSCTLIFGPYHARIKYCPEDIRKYIINIPGQAESYEGYNEFENLNRGQYRFLFTQVGKTSEFYRFIIEPILRNWDSQDINSFFALFGDLNIISSHLKTQSIDQKKKDIPTFFRLSCRMIAAFATRLREIVLKENAMLYSDNKVHVVFSSREEKEGGRGETKGQARTDIPVALYRHEITKFLERDYFSKMMENPDNIRGDVEVDILDIDGTRIKFGMNYCECMGIIAHLVKNNKVRAIALYGTNICLRKI